MFSRNNLTRLTNKLLKVDEVDDKLLEKLEFEGKGSGIEGDLLELVLVANIIEGKDLHNIDFEFYEGETTTPEREFMRVVEDLLPKKEPHEYPFDINEWYGEFVIFVDYCYKNLQVKELLEDEGEDEAYKWLRDSVRNFLYDDPIEETRVQYPEVLKYMLKHDLVMNPFPLDWVRGIQPGFDK